MWNLLHACPPWEEGFLLCDSSRSFLFSLFSLFLKFFLTPFKSQGRAGAGALSPERQLKNKYVKYKLCVSNPQHSSVVTEVQASVERESVMCTGPRPSHYLMIDIDRINMLLIHKVKGFKKLVQYIQPEDILSLGGAVTERRRRGMRYKSS